MGKYHVVGGSKISGEISACGAKNSVLPILAATILNGGTSVIHNCPIISDTLDTVEILKFLGCKVKIEGTTIVVNSKNLKSCEIPTEFAKKMRSSILFLGSMLARSKKAIISYPGGCELGLRPIDLHLRAFRRLQINISDERGMLFGLTERIVGCKIDLDLPSVGATENIMLASVFCEGETIITNAAKEPEISDLENFLNGMGASIKGAGTDTIIIQGVKKLHDVEHTVISDRIVSGTYLLAAAITKGTLTLTNIDPCFLRAFISKLSESGCHIKEFENKLELTTPKTIKSIPKIITQAHPGFPTDMQSQMMAFLSTAKGTSVIEETIFESRIKHIGELVKMGADITLSQDGKTAIIKGVKKLTGAEVSAKDLRGGAALIIAALAADGETTVTGSQFVERGYDKIHEDLKFLGANITLSK